MLSLLLFVSLTFFCNVTLNAQVEHCGIVEYHESAKHLHLIEKTIKPQIPSSSYNVKKIKSRMGKFIVNYDDNYFMTEGVLHCLKLAIDTWEDRIIIKKPINFFVRISEKMDTDVAISTKVGYSRYKVGEFEALPDNLYNQFYKGTNFNDTITINALLNWDSSWQYDTAYSGTINMSNAFLRNIARILGFGCSVVIRDSGLGFKVNRFSSPFDRLLTNDEIFLSELKKEGKPIDFERFFSSKLYLKSNKYKYAMYNCGHFESEKSGVYFNLGYDNIMEYPLKEKNKLMNINNETLNVISDIGWQTYLHDLCITCDSVDILGCGSIFNKQIFNIVNPIDGKKLKGDWFYQIYNTITCKYENISMKPHSEVFVVTPNIIEKSFDEFLYQQGRIVCKVGNKEYTRIISLDVRPLIKDVRITNVRDVNKDFYQFDIDIKGMGANNGTVVVSDDTGVTNCYDYSDGTIHVSPMVKGSKVYIDVSLENDYGESGRFMEVGCLYPSAMLNNKKNDIFHVDVKINNNGAENKIKAGDLVTLSLLNDNNIEIDSVEWRIYLKQLNGEDYYCTLSKDKQFSFTNSPGMFNCYFSKPYNKFMQGYNWEDLKEVNPDSCFYACKIYYKEGSDRVSKYICSDFIPFDVLPTDPVISISKIWVPDWADDFPICRIMIDGENYDCGIVMIAEYNNNIGVHVDDIFYEIPDTGLLVYPGHWDNGIYCWTINKYGQAMSSIIKPSTVGISQEYGDNVDLFVEDKEIIIKSPNSVDVYIYNINGTLEKVSKNSTMYTTVLNKGVYVIKIFNNNTNKVLTNKVCIK